MKRHFVMAAGLAVMSAVFALSGCGGNGSAGPATQLWYDQYLPPAMGQVHLDTCQDLFGMITTPEKAASKFQEAMEKYNAEKE